MMKRSVIILVGVVALVGMLTGVAWAAAWQPISQPVAPQGQGTVWQILAEKLGITLEELQKLWTEARTEVFSTINRAPGAGQFGPPARTGRRDGRGVTLRARDGTGPRCRR